MSTSDGLKKQLAALVASVSDLYAVMITDRDGVPVLKYNTDNAPEQATRAQFLATYGVACDQASKMGLGTNKHLICYYGNYQLLLVNRHPLLVTFVAGTNANTGYLHTLMKEIDEILKELKPLTDIVVVSSSS